MTLRARALIALTFAAAGTIQSAPNDCAACHVDQAKKFENTTMRRALESVADGRILKANPDLRFELGQYRYRIRRDGDKSLYIVSDGAAEITRPILWAFGLGKAGQTYVIEHEGALYESRVSFYQETSGLDLTIGAPAGVPKNMEEALGHKLTAHDVSACFGCHTVPGKITMAQATEGHLIPGMQCVSCHKGAEKHAANPAAAKPVKFSTYSAEDISELCGSCHRTWADISIKGPKGVANVRFQPYRLTNSKCYDASDRRIACVACHDPHGRDEKIQLRSDAACASCHGTQSAAKTARVCKIGKENCAPCHMPKYQIENSHHMFPDHQIRIARTHDAYPN